MDIFREEKKKQLRQKFLMKRKQLTLKQVQEKSQKIVNFLQKSSELQQANVVMSYLSYGKEVNLQALHEVLWEKGVQVAVPIVQDMEHGQMIASIFLPEDLKKMIKTNLGVKEPSIQRFVSPQEIDVILVPGVAFDSKGGRMGHGKGFYDRFLPSLRDDAKKIGVCYELQITSQVLLEDWDVSLPYLCTEAGLRSVEKKK